MCDVLVKNGCCLTNNGSVVCFERGPKKLHTMTKSSIYGADFSSRNRRAIAFKRGCNVMARS